MTPSQSCRLREVSESIGDALPIVGFTKRSLPIRESVCNPMAWQLE
jgi:hypothetical protein